MKQIPFTRKPLSIAISAAAAATALSVSAPAVAEEAELSEEVVIVTGSRIRRQDYNSNAPVATVDGSQIDISNTINVEALLNTLPQMVPGLDRTSNNPGNGTATVDLRGLGSNRTLVLIDGKRVLPTTGGGTVDINSIPAAMIERVEVLTGGASAIYGSDAVAGVVNFILKDDFEGLDVTTSYESTEDNDAQLFSVDITMGAPFDGGRGHAMLNFHHTDREDLFQGDRDFSFFAQFDDEDDNGNPILINGGSSGIPGTSIFSGALGAFSPSFGVTFEPNGSIRPFETTGDNDFYNYAPVNYIQLPQQRYQSTALLSYDLSDSIEVYGRGMFTHSDVPQQLAATPIFQTTTFTLDGSPFLDANAQQVLSDAHGSGVDSDGNGIDDTATAFVRRRLLEVGERQADSESRTYQFQVGLRGELNDIWHFDAYAQTGEVLFTEVQLGNVNRDRFNQALLLDLSDPTGATCSDPGANGGTSACAPINIFGQGNISQAAADFLKVAVSSRATFEQSVAAVSIDGHTGDWFSLPAGPIGLAAGIETIDNEFKFEPSQDLATGNIAGFNGAPAVRGGYDVSSFYGEFNAPLVEGAMGVIELEGAARFADYSTVGNVQSYKVASSWAINDDIRLRASWNTAVRAPSISELFQPQSEGFPGATDPCSAESSTIGDSAVQSICAATGVPQNVIGTPAINLPAGQARGIFGGNPGLAEEEAETMSFGVVWTPTNAALEGLQMSVDWTDIEIEEFIASFGGGVNNVLTNCYDPATGGAGSPFCNVVNRRSDGTIDFVEVLSQNVATQTLQVIDIVGSYSRPMWGGILDFSYLGTFTQENEFVAFAGDTPIVCEGRFGLDCGEPVPEYKHRIAARWSNEDLLLQLLWRYVGEVSDDDAGTTYFVETVDGWNYFDLYGTYQVNEWASIGFGVDNLLDEGPPIIGDNQEQANTYPATYDVFGRTYFLRLTADFGR